MNCCFMRVGKIKTNAQLHSAHKHNYRNVEVPNADPAKTALNEELIPLLTSKNYISAYFNRIKGFVAAPRTDAVKALDFVMAYNPRTVKADFDEVAWKEENVQWLQDTFGKENVVSAVLHKDEGAPHIHALVIPVVNGRLNARYYTGGKKAMSDLQTSYANYMEKVGLERGVKYSHAKHETISRFYGAIDKILSQELPLPEEGESAHDYRSRANEVYAESNLKHFAEAKRLESKALRAKVEKEASDYENKRLKEELALSDKTKRQAQLFLEVLKGLKNGYFPTAEENDNFKKQMQAISIWERNRERDAGER